MASPSPVHFTNSLQPNSNQDTYKTGLVTSVGSTRSYGTVKDSPSNSFLGTGLVKNCVSHTVEEGDTLQGLAVKYNVTVHQIQRLNNIWNTDSLHIRPTIKIPVVHSNNSSRSQSPSPTMSRKTDCKTRLSVEHLPSAFGDNGRLKSQTVSSCNGSSVEEDDEVRSKVISRRRYESDSVVGADGVKSITDILTSADEQLKLSREFAEKLAQRSAQRALPEGAYNRTADMKDHTRREHHSPSPSHSVSMENSSKSRRTKVIQSSVKESASREERVDEIYEL